MNIEELKQNIKDGDGKWVAKENFIFTWDEDDETIHVSCTRDNEIGKAFLMNHSDGNFNKFYMSGNFNLEDVNKYINFCQMLIDILDMDVSIGSVVTKEVQVEVIKKEPDEKMAGMVEAYEKILLGRGLNISK